MKKIAEAFYREQILSVFEEAKGNHQELQKVRENIVKAVQWNLLKKLSLSRTSIKLGSPIIHTLGNSVDEQNSIFNGLFDNLKQLVGNKKIFAEDQDQIDGGALFSISVLQCLLDAIASFAIKSDGIVNKLFRFNTALQSIQGTEFENVLTLEILPRTILSYYDAKYDKMIDKNGKEVDHRELWKIHTQTSRELKSKLFGPASYFSKNDYGLFDVFGRQYLIRGDQLIIVGNIAKHSKEDRSFTFEQSMIGLDAFRNVYDTLLEVADDPNKFNPDKTTIRINFNSPMFNRELNNIEAFIDVVLTDLMKRGSIGQQTVGVSGQYDTKWAKLSKSDVIKYYTINALNELLQNVEGYIGTTPVESNLLKHSFRKMLLKVDSNFIETLKNDLFKKYRINKGDIIDLDNFIRNKVAGNVEHYYGAYLGNDGSVKYGLVLGAVIETYLPGASNEQVSIYNIKDSRFDSSNLESNKDYDKETGNLLGPYTFAFKIKDNKITYRLYKVRSNLKLEGGWQIGIPDLETGEIISVIITDGNGRKLYGRIKYEGYSITERVGGVHWWRSSSMKSIKENNYIRNLKGTGVGDYSGIRVINAMFTRYGDMNQIMWVTTDLINPYLDFDFSHDFYTILYKNFPIPSRRPKSGIINMLPFLRQFPITADILAKESSMRDLVLTHIFDIAQKIIDHSGLSEYLPVYDNILKVLNAYEDKSGVIHLGPGYKELSHLFKTVIGSSAYSFSFNNFRDDIEDINHLTYNKDQSFKDWLKIALDLYQNYQLPSRGNSDPVLKALDEKIRAEIFDSIGNNKFVKGGVPRTFSDGDDFLQGYDGHEDKVLIEEIISTTTNLYGGFTLSKLLTGSIFVQNGRVQFALLTWDSLFKAHKNAGLVNEHLNVKFPSSTSYTTAQSQVVDEMILRPSIEVTIKYGVNEEVEFIQIPHIPTDYWDPNIKSQNEVSIESLDLTKYSNGLSNLLLKYWGKKQRSQIVYRTQRAYGNRLVYNVLFEKYKEQIENNIADDETQFIYLNVIGQLLYQYIYYGHGPALTNYRKMFQKFLVDGGKETLELLGLIPLPTINGINFKEIILSDLDLRKWYDDGIVDIMHNSLTPIGVVSVKEYSAKEIIRNLNEPISSFGNSLKNLALRFGKPSKGSKKIYIIPQGITSGGLGQYYEIPNQFIAAANKIVKLNNKDFYSWEIDGTNNGDNLVGFNKHYKDVVRAFLEGYKTLFIFAAIESGGEVTQIEGIGSLNILSGALLPSEYADDYTNQLIDGYFNSDNHYHSLEGITFYDSEFYSKENKYNIINIMNSFRAYNSYTVPFSKFNKYQEAWNLINSMFSF